MTAIFSNFASQFTSLSWLAGPIFTKELRVSSRRRRNYVLRFAYLLLLTIFVGLVWAAAVNITGRTSAVFRVSRMPEAGRHIVTAVVWFQFLAAQLIAVVMLSSAISDEIYRHTLGLLMTTPVSSFQIVMGKLCSRLLQLILLLAISLPFLAVVRVFGGVPSDYVFSTFCVTLTAAVFAGSISLFLSIHIKKAHEVVITTVFTCAALYAILPALLRMVSTVYRPFNIPDSLLLYFNPFAVIIASTHNLLSPSSASGAINWPLHCVFMICGAALLLGLSALSVRAAGLRQVIGQAGIFLSRKERRTASGRPARHTRSAAAVRKIRHIKGAPVVWREMNIPLMKGRRPITLAALVGVVIVLSLAYGYCAYEKRLQKREVQMAFVLVYFLGGLFAASTAAAASITSEREARTWPVLLTTALGETEIVLGKIIGSCWRVRPFWLLLAAHVIVFTLARCIHPVAVLPLALVAFTSALLVSALGVFSSACFRRTSAAAAANLVFFLVFILPFCCPLPVFLGSPLFIAAMILLVAGGSQAAATPFYKLGYQTLPLAEDFLGAVGILIGITILYVFIGFVVFRVTEDKIRSKIFGSCAV
ncbi:MAG: ABC transporter permease subunit [Planctomycetota bacterium]|jgi:ABC-type transport system involved in multi-copper enzyme maturation permease subunit